MPLQLKRVNAHLRLLTPSHHQTTEVGRRNGATRNVPHLHRAQPLITQSERKHHTVPDTQRIVALPQRPGTQVKEKLAHLQHRVHCPDQPTTILHPHNPPHMDVLWQDLDAPVAQRALHLLHDKRVTILLLPVDVRRRIRRGRTRPILHKILLYPGMVGRRIAKCRRHISSRFHSVLIPRRRAVLTVLHTVQFLETVDLLRMTAV